MLHDFSQVVSEQQHQQQSQGGPGYTGTSGPQQNQPPLMEQFRELQTTVANTIGNAAITAKKLGLPERSAQEIVSRAYRQDW